LLLGYLTGVRGVELFQTAYARALDCPKERAIELAESAAVHGWIVLKHLGEVWEVRFPNLLTRQEMELVSEQT